MKNLYLLPFLLLLFSATISLSLQVDNSTSTESEEAPEPSAEEQFRQLFAGVDTDSDGTISPSEALAFWKAKAETMDPEELKKRLEKFNAKTLEEAVDRGFKKVDKDSDGKVSPEELKAYIQS